MIKVIIRIVNGKYLFDVCLNGNIVKSFKTPQQAEEAVKQYINNDAVKYAYGLI